MSRLLVVAMLVACGPSLETANRNATQANERSTSRLEERRAAAGAPFQPALTSFAPTTRVAAGPGTHGLAEQERVYTTPSGLVFVGGYCVDQAPCGQGCARSAEYHFAHAADGHVVIVRERPIIHVVQVKVKQCGTRCGGAQPQEALAHEPGEPPPQLGGHALGIDTLDQLEVRDTPYAVELVDTWCDHPIPVP